MDLSANKSVRNLTTASHKYCEEIAIGIKFYYNTSTTHVKKVFIITEDQSNQPIKVTTMA